MFWSPFLVKIDPDQHFPDVGNKVPMQRSNPLHCELCISCVSVQCVQIFPGAGCVLCLQLCVQLHQCTQCTLRIEVLSALQGTCTMHIMHKQIHVRAIHTKGCTALCCVLCFCAQFTLCTNYVPNQWAMCVQHVRYALLSMLGVLCANRVHFAVCSVFLGQVALCTSWG